MKNLSKSKKVLLIVLTIVMLLCAAVFGAFQYMFGGLKKNNIDKTPSSLGIEASAEKEFSESKITNIAIFGLDGRNLTVDEGRSDSLMILSLNGEKNVVKLISILRDSYVAIDGHGHEKICHAYSYGGPELAIKTLNKNFNLNIKDYVTANFAQFAGIVDYMGGVDITITQKEMNEINRMVDSSSDQLNNYGAVHLNGNQALHYSRIRYIDSDNARANRQRTVLEALFNKAKRSGVTSSLGLIKNIMPMLETSLNYVDVVGFVQRLLGSGASMTQAVIPDKEENAIGGLYQGAWVWRYDLEAASKRLKKIILE